MVQVDGAETLGASGGVQATVSQEAVQEFQVVRNSYSAELGGAAGGVVNIVSKSGGNNSMAARSGSSATRHSTRATLSISILTANRPSAASSTAARSAARCDRTRRFSSPPSSGSVRSAPLSSTSGDPNMFQQTASQNALLNFLSGVPQFAPLLPGCEGVDGDAAHNPALHQRHRAVPV